jgi:hypothetical protein
VECTFCDGTSTRCSRRLIRLPHPTGLKPSSLPHLERTSRLIDDTHPRFRALSFALCTHVSTGCHFYVRFSLRYMAFFILAPARLFSAHIFCLFLSMYAAALSCFA